MSKEITLPETNEYDFLFTDEIIDKLCGRFVNKYLSDEPEEVFIYQIGDYEYALFSSNKEGLMFHIDYLMNKIKKKYCE